MATTPSNWKLPNYWLLCAARSNVRELTEEVERRCPRAQLMRMGCEQGISDVARVLLQVAVGAAVSFDEPATAQLLTDLADADYSVSLETSGALPVDAVDQRISRIVDIKTPGSGEVDRMCWDNLAQLNAQDEIKFVLCDRHDYEWARNLVQARQLDRIAPVLFSPVWETLPPADLAAWVLQDRLPVRVQVQLHKILWGERPGV